MPHEVNALGQPIGVTVPNWSPPPRPSLDPMIGRYCRVEPLDAAPHAADLHAANRVDAEGRNWTYLPYGPFATLESYTAWVASVAGQPDPQFWAVIDLTTGKAVGVASYLRIDPASGSIEVGHINFSPLLQRTPAGTEAMYLMMQRAFTLGYRRYEWKCDALNAASRAAAQRYGFSYEGIFRQARLTKGHNRDTAWYAAIDSEWPALDRAYRQWLDPSNFDPQGRQRVALSALTSLILVQRG
ncbi:MAG: GNAT family N-acetyltransferase [Acidobacteria bacterium]|nr:GNAT family N-acetyltransferase [Acidobacteriota bacterium]